MAIISETIRLLGAEKKETLKEQYFYGLVQKNVLVTGSNGQLGNELKLISDKSNLPFRFLYTDFEDLDITNRDQVDEFVRINNINFIINCAAYTAVDNAETDREKAYAVNVEGIANLAGAAKMNGAKIIHISTDFVFDGMSDIPYKEDMPTNPLSVYGKTKLEGEKVLQELGGDWIIIRTSWLYSEFGVNFVKSMIRLMNERDSLTIVEDEKGSPTYAADLAEMIIFMLQSSETDEWKTGIYHFCNKGDVTRFDFAREIKRQAGIDDYELKPIKSSDYGSPAVRPAYSTLDTSKISNAFRVEIPRWEEALGRCIKKLNI